MYVYIIILPSKNLILKKPSLQVGGLIENVECKETSYLVLQQDFSYIYNGLYRYRNRRKITSKLSGYIDDMTESAEGKKVCPKQGEGAGGGCAPFSRGVRKLLKSYGSEVMEPHGFSYM